MTDRRCGSGGEDAGEVSAESLDRRAALTRLAGLAALGLAPVSGCAPIFGAGHRSELVVDRQRLGEGSALVARFRDRPVILVDDGGTIRAFSGLCTHEGCELGWNARQRLIRCPCHASAFDTAGQVTSGPAPRPLPEFPTRVAGGKIVVVVPEER